MELTVAVRKRRHSVGQYLEEGKERSMGKHHRVYRHRALGKD
jgi:hypothetical protein